MLESAELGLSSTPFKKYPFSAAYTCQVSSLGMSTSAVVTASLFAALVSTSRKCEAGLLVITPATSKLPLASTLLLRGAGQ